MLGLVGQMGIAGGGENGMMTKEFLNLDQIDAGLDQVSGITMPEAVRGDLFFRPQLWITLCIVI
jgi:hypothetical protein